MFGRTVFFIIFCLSLFVVCSIDDYDYEKFKTAAEQILEDLPQKTLTEPELKTLENGNILYIWHLHSNIMEERDSHQFFYGFKIIKKEKTDGQKVWSIFPEFLVLIPAFEDSACRTILSNYNVFYEETYKNWGALEAKSAYYKNRPNKYQIRLVRAMIKKTSSL